MKFFLSRGYPKILPGHLRLPLASKSSLEFDSELLVNVDMASYTCGSVRSKRGLIAQLGIVYYKRKIGGGIRVWKLVACVPRAWVYTRRTDFQDLESQSQGERNQCRRSFQTTSRAINFVGSLIVSRFYIPWWSHNENNPKCWNNASRSLEVRYTAPSTLWKSVRLYNLGHQFVPGEDLPQLSLPKGRI